MYRALVLALAVSLAALGALPAGAVGPDGHHDGVWVDLVESLSSLWHWYTVGGFAIIQDGSGGSDELAGCDQGVLPGVKAVSAADGTGEPPADGFRGEMDPDG